MNSARIGNSYRIGSRVVEKIRLGVIGDRERLGEFAQQKEDHK
jgi:hypothetical protein